jgi:4-hydroxy-4-methyl-2-oxoglutarate aldolase
MIESPPVLRIRTSRHRPSDAQIAAFQNVPTGFVADAMSGTGALDRQIAPLAPGVLPVSCAGPALTVQNQPGDILGLIAALTEVEVGDVMVNGVGGWQGCAAIGDRVSGMLKNAGAAGVVTDGPARDFDGIALVGLPVFCTGLTPNSPTDTGPALVGYPIQIGGRTVGPGDMIVADRDGVVTVPFDQIDHVLERIDRVRTLETELDAQVADGLTCPPSMIERLKQDDVSYE